MKRTEIYKKYKNFKIIKPEKILKQQLFLMTYVKDNYDKIDKMLLYHGIGVGKTCTSIRIAETIMENHKNMKILVILPARLKTNYIDELISKSCGINKYITDNEFTKFKKPETPINEKDEIRNKFMERINKNYEIVSFERFRKILLDSKDYKKTIDEITKNRVIIIDEVHNLLASNLDEDTITKNLKLNIIDKKSSPINGIILRLMTKLANKTAKFFFLTATPVFDNYNQFIQLVLNLQPTADIKKTNNLKYLINLLKGKVSYYKFEDLSAFPKVKIDNIRIKMSKTQMDIIKNLDDKKENIESNIFCINERQKAISAYDISKKELIFSNLNEYAPKLKKLFDLLRLPGKHVIYSNFIKYSLYLIASYLEKNGWNNYMKSGSKDYKSFVIWDASLKDNQKQEIKSLLNSYNNIGGKIIRIILGSPSIKEGISFKHVQHLHQIDPVWNSSAKEQIEGRVIRYKSHEQIKPNDPRLKKEVIIHNYIGTSGLRDYTLCDEKIYDDIIIKKEKLVKGIEKLLIKVSIDYYLWGNKSSPISKSKSRSSLISVSSVENRLRGMIMAKKIKEINKDEISNCPKIRRPVNKTCLNSDYPYLHKNKQGFLCCYKKLQKNLKS
jgi:hypothetical protein